MPSDSNELSVAVEISISDIVVVYYVASQNLRMKILKMVILLLMFMF